ncbi:dual specificity protein kinase pyk3-like isoform X2 [Drosophila albomicans]|uniref:Dual specificity protein kinase pyk3-like isoform X2 n=1 Tax=Drosophila albomicans TaxID=7291 RepID=A0A9C6WM45_DROAB|nr:dual specificity protein kinase pyk3-like isoform X2 [Drosophila albomicans]
MAPEICNASGEFTQKSDVFSFGIICWEVMSRKKPFEEFKDMEKLVLQNKIMNGERPDIDYLKEYKDADSLLPIIQKCWDQDPSNRPPMNELCNLLPKYPRASIVVNYNALKLGKYIGTGSYGIVFKATWQAEYETRDIAVKIIQDAQKQKAIQKEIHDLKALYHANIAKLYGFSIDREDRILMLVEYADCGSLCNLLYRTDNEVTFYTGLDWILQCAEGMEYLHGKNILHQDLKTENLLLFDNFRILKICDYGRVKEFATMNKEFSGIDNRAPEVRVSISKYVKGSDRPNLIEMMKHEDIDIVKSIIKKCWDQDPDKRPSMKELCVLLKIYPFINFDDIQFGKRFERGGFGVSYKAIWKTEGQEKDVNAKIHSDKTSNSEKISRRTEMLFLKKAHNLKQMKHENVGTFYGASKDPKNTIYFLLYEYSECGSVYNFLHRTKNELAYVEKINWMLQCAKGVEYLWSQGITLRFIKPQTLMLFDVFRTLKVFEYGSAKELSKFNKQEMVQFAYIAPEIHAARKNTDFKKSLVFSFGIIFWEVMSGKEPFHDYEIADVPKIIISGSRPNIDDIKSCNDAYLIKPIIEKCWDQNAENRPTITELSSLLSYLTAGKL